MRNYILSILLFFAFEALCAQDSLTITLEKIVVSSSRWCQESESQPIKISRITFDDANVYNPQTMADLLGLTGEVFIQKSQYGGGSPMIRGFATNRLLYSIDGVRMNSAIFRAGNIQNVISVDPFAVEASEVLFGPGAVSYGSDAIGGAMIFRTLTPKLSNDKNPCFYGGATVRTATASNELTTHLHAGVGWKQWALLTSFTFSSFDDLEQGKYGPEKYVMPYIVLPNYNVNGVFDVVTHNSDKRRQAPSGYSQFNYMQKLRYKPAAAWNIEYAFHLSRTSEYARYDRHQRMRKEMPRYAEWNYGPQKWMMNQLSVEHAARSLFYDSLRINFALQHFEESRISRELNKPLREIQSEEVDAWSANIDFLKRATKNFTFSYGVEYVQNNVHSTAKGVDVVTGTLSAVPARYPKAKWYSAALFAQSEWHITNRLNLVSGLRYNYYYIDNDFSSAGYYIPFEPQQSSGTGSISGNVGLNWRPLYGWLFRLNYARGFRAPNVDDMGKLFDSADGCVTVPNPSLKPEYADNFELGIAKIFGNYLEADVTAYYTHLDNAIVRRDFLFNGSGTMLYQGEECRVQALQNVAVARVWGIQSAVDVKITRDFYASARVNYQYGREELDNGETSPLRHAAPLFGRAALGYTGKRFSAEAFTCFQAECSADDMPDEEKEKTEFYALDALGNAYSPAWITLNIRASYKFAKSLTVNASLENVTDRRYRPYCSGISAPGRNLTLSLNYSFF